ncbi:MAG TPA: methyltransferase domain-containing protein [Marmoricola sp.]|nr:methyltransferase domain-containing protein [Marmoricola sp.]
MTAAAPKVEAVRVDDRGIWFKSPVDDVVDVCFDGRRVWSFWLQRDSSPDGGGRLAGWPSALVRFLDGTTELSLVAHVSGVTLYDGEVRLGSGEGRIAVVSPEGKPLGLDKSNRLSQTFDTRSPEQVAPLLDSIEQVLAAIADAGVEAFLAYGTLLGAVREGALIGHDSDADLGYVSRHSHPLDVILESFRLQRHLSRLGYTTYRYSGIAFKVEVIEADGFRRGLDVFGGFIAAPVGDQPPMLYLMGEIGSPFELEWIYPLTTATLEGRAFPVPAVPERLLEATYGPGWRVPDPAYHFETARPTVQRLNGWFRGIRVLRSEWERRHSSARDRRLPSRPSDLAVSVVAEEGVPAQVVDLGAGRGGDALWFARQGAAVTALDFVPRAIEQVQARAKEEGLDLSVREVNLLSLRSTLAEGARLAHTPGPRAVIARHLVDATVASGRAGAWRLCEMALRDGGRLYLEFWSGPRTPRTETQLLAAVPVDTVVAELTARGAVIVHREETQVERAEGQPARTLARLVAQWHR